MKSVISKAMSWEMRDLLDCKNTPHMGRKISSFYLTNETKYSNDPLSLCHFTTSYVKLITQDYVDLLRDFDCWLRVFAADIWVILQVVLLLMDHYQEAIRRSTDFSMGIWQYQIKTMIQKEMCIYDQYDFHYDYHNFVIIK